MAKTFPKNPKCPECSGDVWDNVDPANKKNPKGPDLKCRDTNCGWAWWARKAKDDTKPAGSAKAKPTAKKAPQRKEEDDDLPF